ncbi:MAG TPA: DUF1648 domain-containing protein [Epulopiscium sp.]|nr:DUF1648 domain-containing protein [Candidatus Epulonipiscium sp.]
MEGMIKLFVMFSLIIGMATIPYFTKGDIHFGVQIPNVDLNKLKKIRIKFILLNIIFGIIATYLMLIIKDPLVGIVGLTFGYVGVGMVIYVLAYKEVKSLKKEMLAKVDYVSKRHVTVVDTSFTKEKGKKMMVSPWYFLIPILITLVVSIISFVNYDVFPDLLPMHYNAAGEIDSWTNKTYLSVFMVPIISLAMTGLFYYIYIIVGKSKQQISAKRPQVSGSQNRKHRKIWSCYTVASAALMNILFGYLQLIMLRKSVEKAEEIMFVTLGLTLLMVIGTLVIGIYTGNGGSKLKVIGGGQEETTEEESDDDQYWKWGLFYYNANDPSVFIEKRVGIGWTMNMGTVQGKLYIIGTLVATIAIVVMAIIKEGYISRVLCLIRHL